MQLQDYCLKVEKYIPLTYIEVEKNKPLIIKLTEEWNFVSYLQKAVNFALIIDRKDFLLRNIEYCVTKESKTDEERSQKDIQLITALNLLISILYEVSRQEYKDKEEEYRKFIQEYFIENTDILFDVWQKVLDYNTKLEKKNTIPAELQDNSGPRTVDRWRGFFAGRGEIQTTPFLKYLHEDEERTIETIRQYKRQKEVERKNSKKPAFR